MGDNSLSISRSVLLIILYKEGVTFELVDL